MESAAVGQSNERKAAFGQNLLTSGAMCFILLVHGWLSLNGFHAFDVWDYSQIVQNQFPKGTPFWEMLLNFHGNPPLLSVFHHWAMEIFPSRPALFFEILLPVFHATSFLSFEKALKGFSLKINPLWPIILFINPLIFIYFRYPFYTSFLFFLSSVLLFLISQLKKKPESIIGIALLLSTGALLRSSWVPLLLFPFVVWLSPSKSWKTRILILICFLPPLVWQIKNYRLINQFTSSSWLGINLARGHLPWKVHSHPVDFIQPFSLPNDYLEIVKAEPGIKETEANQNFYLSQNNLNHKSIPVISSLYLESIFDQFSLTWSLNTFMNGFLIYFQSPANEEHILDHLKDAGYESIPYFHSDWLDPRLFKDPNLWYLFLVSDRWDPDSSWIQAFRRITVYTLLYPILLGIFLIRFHILTREIKAIFILTLFFTGIYTTLDVSECNRMRMEIECLFYFLIIWATANWKILFGTNRK